MTTTTLATLRTERLGLQQRQASLARISRPRRYGVPRRASLADGAGKPTAVAKPSINRRDRERLGS